MNLFYSDGWARMKHTGESSCHHLSKGGGSRRVLRGETNQSVQAKGGRKRRQDTSKPQPTYNIRNKECWTLRTIHAAGPAPLSLAPCPTRNSKKRLPGLPQNVCEGRLITALRMQSLPVGASTRLQMPETLVAARLPPSLPATAAVAADASAGRIAPE